MRWQKKFQRDCKNGYMNMIQYSHLAKWSIVALCLIIFWLLISSYFSGLIDWHGTQVDQSITIKNLEFERYINASTHQTMINFCSAFGRFLNDESKVVGGFIGGGNGKGSRAILQQWTKCTKYYIIDYHHDGAIDNKQEMQHLHYLQLQKNVTQWKNLNIVEIKQKKPIDAAMSIPDDELDFVFLNFRNDYRSMWEDINAYWPKVKVGGIFSGRAFVNLDDNYGDGVVCRLPDHRLRGCYKVINTVAFI